MHENVGRLDQTVHAFLGPALITLGFAGLGAHCERTLGLAAVIGGVLLVKYAMTRVCPTNYVLGVDTKELEDDLFARRANA